MEIVNNIVSSWGLSENTYTIIVKVIRIAIICLGSLLLMKLSNKKSKFVKRINSKLNRDSTGGIFISKITRGAIIIIAIFLILSELDYDVSTLVASLGIGGVVIALAAQDIAKNFFGGVTIITDKPFKVNDWIEIGEISGTIEDITIRSTRIRSIDGSLIVLPNSTLANANVINYGNMTYRRYKFGITFTFNTPLEKIDGFISKAYEVVENIPNTIKGRVRIFFDGVVENGLRVNFFIDTTETEYWAFMKYNEIVNYEITTLIQYENLELAYPTQTINMKEGGNG